MTTKERVIAAIEALPTEATIGDAIEELRRLERAENDASSAAPSGEALTRASAVEAIENPWKLLEYLTGTLQAPPDWALEHDHYLYGAPKQSGAA